MAPAHGTPHARPKQTGREQTETALRGVAGRMTAQPFFSSLMRRCFRAVPPVVPRRLCLASLRPVSL